MEPNLLRHTFVSRCCAAKHLELSIRKSYATVLGREVTRLKRAYILSGA